MGKKFSAIGASVKIQLFIFACGLLLLVPVYEYVTWKQQSTAYITETAQVVSTQPARCSHKRRISGSCHFVTVKYFVTPTKVATYRSQVPVRPAYAEGDAIALDVATDNRWDVRLRDERPFALGFLGIPSLLALSAIVFALLGYLGTRRRKPDRARS